MSQRVLTEKELEERYGDEEVYVVEKGALSFLSEGINCLPITTVDLFLKTTLEKGFFVRRSKAEYNPAYYQIVPYVVIRCGEKYFAIHRLNGDVRIVGKISIGVGGHINPVDFDPERKEIVFSNNVIRELYQEELHIDLLKTTGFRYAGVIKYTHPEDLLSKDHIGLLCVLTTTDDKVEVKEKDSFTGRFYSRAEILEHRKGSESWARLVIEMIAVGLI